jgi:hypothetical protein
MDFERLFGVFSFTFFSKHRFLFSFSFFFHVHSLVFLSHLVSAGVLFLQSNFLSFHVFSSVVPVVLNSLSSDVYCLCDGVFSSASLFFRGSIASVFLLKGHCWGLRTIPGLLFPSLLVFICLLCSRCY